MPIKHAIWTIDDNPGPLNPSRLENEQLLEDIIVSDPSILSSDWLVIGRQVRTAYDGRIDVLAIAPDGSLVLIELKRDRTPRDVAAQALDYASWVKNLSSEQISRIYIQFSGGESLDQAFRDRFGTGLEEDALNQAHQIVIVSSELDASTERIINYLNDGNIPINVMLFQVFEHGNEKLLSRAWLVEPEDAQDYLGQRDKGEPWNGEFYVNYDRDWSDALKYGIVTAGGGYFYSRTLGNLSPGDRIWVKAPGKGFVGVGRIISAKCPIRELEVQTDSGLRPALEVLQNAREFISRDDNPETADYYVGVKWLDTVSDTSQAFQETGLFGNQNTVVRPRDPKWVHTVERLKIRFPKWHD